MGDARLPAASSGDSLASDGIGSGIRLLGGLGLGDATRSGVVSFGEDDLCPNLLKSQDAFLEKAPWLGFEYASEEERTFRRAGSGSFFRLGGRGCA